jgi:probable HAF family extracellular repeat protein
VTGLYFAANGERRAFLWDHGTVSDLGTLGGIAQTFAVNDGGTAVGYSVDLQNRQRAIRVQAGAMQDLGTLRGGTHAAANDINNAGWIVGMSEFRHGNDTWQRAALWRNGSVIDLGTFGGEFSEANAVNEAGQVVGWAWYPLPTRALRAFRWSDATGMVDLGTLGGGTSIASDINDQGAVVGSAATASGATHAFRWTLQTGMTDLGVPSGALESSAAAINNQGLIVGSSYLPLECRVEPLLWEHGVLHRLNDLIDPTSGWTLIQASDIDDLGNIAATARRGASYRAVLLVPYGP